MSVMPQSFQKAALPLAAAGALTVPVSSLQADIPDAILSGDYNIAYRLDLDEVNGIGLLDENDTIWTANAFGVDYTDDNSSLSIFQSSDAIIDGIFIIIDGDTGMEDIAYFNQGGILGRHGDPFRDSVKTFISADDMTSSFSGYGSLLNFTNTISGPYGIFDYGPEGLDLQHMFGASVVDLYDFGEFHGELSSGQTFIGGGTIMHLPAPGAGALLALGGLAAGRRRRSDNDNNATAATAEADATAGVGEMANDAMA